MKLIILSNTLGIRKDAYIDYHLDYLKENYETQFYALGKITGKIAKITNHTYAEVVESIEILESKLTEDNELKIIINISGEELFKIFAMIRCTNCKYIFFKKENNLINFFKKRDVFYLTKSYIKEFLLINTRRYKKNYGDFKVDYLLSTHNHDKRLFDNLIPSHSPKYDQYLDSMSIEKKTNDSFILFIDSNIVDHPDYENYNSGKLIDKSNYFKRINSFFKLLEEKYKTRVIISLHPTSNYDTNPFDGREMTKYNTPLLIKNSFAVVSHFTTSVQTVVLEEKPWIFVYTNDMLTLAPSNATNKGMKIAKYLKSTIVNLDSTNDIKLHVQLKRYRKFEENFIVSHDNKELSNKEILLDLIKKIENNY